MGEKEPIKIRLGTIISIIIIILLVIALVVMYFYYNYDVIPKAQELGDTQIKESAQANGVENDETLNEEISLYEKYNDLYWQFRDNEEDKTSIEFDNKKIEIKNGTAYLYSGSNEKEITDIEGTAKFVNMYGEQTLERVYILTEEGTIWKSICENGLNDSFTKVNTEEKVIDMTSGNSSIRVIEPPYFLLANGELVNEEGSSYEELDGNFVNSFGNAYSVIYVKADNTIFWYDYETEKYIQIKNQDGNIVKMKDAFLQWSTERNNLVEETGGEDRVFIITEDEKLYYFDGYSNAIAKEYKETAGKIIKSAIEEKQEIQYGETINMRITFSDGTEIVLEDANRNFFGN